MAQMTLVVHPEGQELLYGARVSLDRTQMQIEDKLVLARTGGRQVFASGGGFRTTRNLGIVPRRREIIRDIPS